MENIITIVYSKHPKTCHQAPPSELGGYYCFRVPALAYPNAWTSCPGPDGSSRRVSSRHGSSRCGGSHISFSTRETKVGTRKWTCRFSFTAKCLHCYAFQVAIGWAGQPAPCALSGRYKIVYSTVAMEYTKGKISARGREISLNHLVTWDTRVRCKLHTI